MANIIKNSTLYLLSTIIIKAASFLLLPFYTHLIKPEEYGYVYVVSSFSTFTSYFLLFSLNSVIGRFYFECKNEQDIKVLYSNITFIVTILSIFISIIILFTAKPLAILLNIPIYCFYFSIAISFFSIYYNLIISLLYVKEQAKQISYTSIFLGIVGILVQMIMVFVMDNKTLALIETMLVNAILSFLIFLYYSIPYFIKPQLLKSELLLYFKYAFSQWPSDICVWLISFSDRLFLNKYNGSHVAGIYGVGNNIAQIPMILFHNINKAYSPFVMNVLKNHENDFEYKYEEIQRSTFIIISFIAFTITILSVFSNEFVFLLSENFKESATVIPLVLLASFIDCIRIIFMYPMVFRIEYVKIKSIIWIASALLNLSLNFLLIPIYSMYGACFSSIISFSLSCILIMYFSNKAIIIPYNYIKLIFIILLSIIVGLLSLVQITPLSLVIKFTALFIYLCILIKINNIKIRNIYGKVFYHK